MTQKISRSNMETRIVAVCAGTHYSFVSWGDADKGMESHFICECKLHGPWQVSAKSFLKMNSRCPGCARETRRRIFNLSSSDAESRITKRIGSEPWDFLGWENEYKNKDSKVRMRCRLHGVWLPTFHNLTHAGTGCPACAGAGFRTDKPAVLYALISEGGGHIKVGISNNFKVRLPGLRWATPFKFSVLEKLSFSGGEARELESYFHSKFASAGLSGFIGATEWLAFDNDIINEFRTLKAEKCLQYDFHQV